LTTQTGCELALLLLCVFYPAVFCWAWKLGRREGSYYPALHIAPVVRVPGPGDVVTISSRGDIMHSLQVEELYENQQARVMLTRCMAEVLERARQYLVVSRWRDDYELIEHFSVDLKVVRPK